LTASVTHYLIILLGFITGLLLAFAWEYL